MAGATGFEPAVSALTGPHVEPLHHAPIDQEVYHSFILRQDIFKKNSGFPLFFFYLDRSGFGCIGDIFGGVFHVLSDDIGRLSDTLRKLYGFIFGDFG